MGKIVSCANTGTNCRYLRCQQLEKDRHCSPRVQQTLAWVVPIFHFSPTEMGSTHTPFTFPSCPPPPPQISATVRIPSLSRCLVGRNNQSVHLEEQFFRIHYKRNHFISIWRRRFMEKTLPTQDEILPLHFVPSAYIFRKDAKSYHDRFIFRNYTIS